MSRVACVSGAINLMFKCASEKQSFVFVFLNRFKLTCCLCVCQCCCGLSLAEILSPSTTISWLRNTGIEGEKNLYSSCYCTSTHSHDPPCLSGASHTWKHPPQHNVAPAFLFAVPPTFTHPLSYQMWPGARLASVNPGTASQTKGSSNQIYVGLGLLWNVAGEHV